MTNSRFFFLNMLLLPGVACILSAVPVHGQTDQRKDSSGIHRPALLPQVSIAPEPASILRSYQAAYPRINDLEDTRLDVRFDFAKRYLYGKEWVTLHPHFYPTDSLELDAKGMAIHAVDLVAGSVRIPLNYTYNGWTIRISLGRYYTRKEKYTLFIDYTSKPDKLPDVQGSAAILSNKGLYFINPDGKDPYKPTEAWTQGESQSNSVWFPTIDRPDQKTREQIAMTVPDRFTTLSNGSLISQHKNTDGTRTDTWKMRHPNSPYLFMMAVGPFTIVKDHWKGIPVNYYVEKAYAPYALDIFGHTPAMIEFYSHILGVPYPWSKYDQVVVRDYVSGAMENTTATLLGEFMYKTRRQLLDDDYANESDIAHELFHHWFGDLVTCKSWSNLTLNESFADFSEMLWAEHEYGKDLGESHSYNAMQAYFRFAAAGNDHPLVDYYYKKREDVFDAVTYDKGGRILNMLRHTVGPDAFFKSLHYYLETYKYHPASAKDLLLAFEHITGKDLNWFWNQWYYGQGFPKLDISYLYPENKPEVSIVVRQTQPGPVFELPFAIDLYESGHPQRHWVNMMDRIDTFTFGYQVKPDLVNVDAEKALLVQKVDHKTLDNYIYQYAHAPLFLDRREAIVACAAAQTTDTGARRVILDALHDRFYGLRDLAEKNLRITDPEIRTMAIPILKSLAVHDPNSGVRAGALQLLSLTSANGVFPEMVKTALQDSSYRVESMALNMMFRYDSAAALNQARSMEQEARSPLSETICAILGHHGDTADFGYIQTSFEKHGSFTKFGFLVPYLHMLASGIINKDEVTRGIDQVQRFGKFLGAHYGMIVVRMLENFVREKKAAARQVSSPEGKASLESQAAYGSHAAETLQKSFSGR